MSLSLLQSYSFADVFGTVTGPGGVSIPLGAGSGSSAEEGISFEQTVYSNMMTVGAAGDGMHTLIQNNSGRVSIHLLKTSPLNAQLNQMLVYQKSSSLYWGINTITVANPVTGDQYTCTQAAFKRRPNNQYSKDPNQIIWEFDAVNVFATLGSGIAGVVAGIVSRI